MNNALKEIAAKYNVAEENISEILAGMKVKDAQKPSKAQLEGFEKVCVMLQEGKPMDQALTILLEEAKNGKVGKEASQVSGTITPEDLDSFILEQAKRAAETTLLRFPQIAREEYNRSQGLFVQAYRQYLAEQLQNPEYRQNFIAAIEEQELGKSELLGSTMSHTALPSSSSSSS